MSTEEEIIRKIQYYQEKLDRYALNKNHKKIITVLGQLKGLPIRTVHLEQTGIGRTVNALKKLGDDVSEVSKSVVTFWKEMVKQEEEEQQDTPDQDSPEQYQSDEPTNEEDLDDQDHEQNHSTEPETEENHNGYESDEYHSEEEYPKKSKTYDSDKSDRDHDREKKHRRKHESNKHKHESHDSSDRKNKNSSGSSDHRDKHSGGHSHKSRDRNISKHSDRDSKKHSDGKSHLKESVVNTDKKYKHYDKKTEHLETTNRNDEQKIDKRHDSNKDHRSYKDRNADKERSSNKEGSSDKNTSEKHKSSDKHHSADRHHGADKHTSHKHRSSEKQNNSDKKNNHTDKADKNSSSGKHTSEGLIKNADKETKSKEKDLKRKHEQELESSSSKKLKGDSSKDSSKEKKGNRSDKKPSSKSKSSKPYGSESGIDSGSGASFAEALGMCSGPSSSRASTSSKKKTHVEKIPETNAIKSEKDSPELEIDPNVPVALKRPQLEPLQINIASLLPEITPNYKPLGLPIDMHPASRRISITDEEALSRAMMNKNQRTKVYSGNKTFGKVESLFDLCVRVLQDNIDALEYTGGVPFSILKPVLQRATPDQLFNLEHHNPYLIEDTDDMWKRHCEKDFRTKKREEMESWREMYMRCLQEREARLSAITANIKQSQDKSLPVRTTKLAYVDSVVKPPRNIARKQAKNGTANAVTPSERLQQISKASEAVKVSVPSAGSRANDRPSTSSQQNKPKKAPLMAKALQSFKKIRR